jgi:hypothetical protein
MAVMLGAPATAAGETLCVPDIGIPNCPAGAANENTIAHAVANGNPGDTILIGPGTFDESVSDNGTPYHFVGEGVGQTVIQGQGSPAMVVSSGSSVSNLSIDLYGANGETGLSLAGIATGVVVTATEQLSATNPIGVDLNGGTFAHGAVTLPLTGTDQQFYGGVEGSGSVSDSSITAPVGITGEQANLGAMPTVDRDTITANEGVVDESAVTIDDSLIRTVAEPSVPDVGIGMDPNVLFGAITARHVTVIGSGAAGSTGVSAHSDAVVGSVATNVTLGSSIIRGYASSISANATAVIGTATTSVTLDHSFYDPTTTHISDSPPTATATITPDSGSGNHDPLFVDAAAGDYHLQAGSPAIDAGAAPASGESTTDLDGNLRSVAGHSGDGAVGDIGAYEFQPHAPTVSAAAATPAVTAGVADTFTATGADASPGDSVTFAWTFDDGATATGASVTHAFATQGSHTATVTATDLDRFTATARATVAVTVPRPKLTHLRCKPKAFRRGGRGTVVSYVDSEPATTTLTVQRKRGKRYVRVRSFMRVDAAGADRFRFRGKGLRPGRYRLLAVPRDAAGAGPVAKATFKIKR